MRRVFLGWSIFTMLLCSSCQSPKTPQDQLATDLLNSQTFNLYIQLCKHLTIGIKSNRYNNSKVDKNYLHSHHADNVHTLPKAELYVIYTTANMTNAKDYIDTQLRIDSTYNALLKEFPPLANMSAVERFQFLLDVRKQMGDIKSDK